MKVVKMKQYDLHYSQKKQDPGAQRLGNYSEARAVVSSFYRMADQ